MKISDILRTVLVEGERLGFDALDALGHPVIVIDQNGDEIGEVDEVAYDNGIVELRCMPK